MRGTEALADRPSAPFELGTQHRHDRALRRAHGAQFANSALQQFLLCRAPVFSALIARMDAQTTLASPPETAAYEAKARPVFQNMDRRFFEDAKAARTELSSLSTYWEGRKCVLELKAENYQWRQMEWFGFYFEMLCRRLLPTAGFAIPGDRIGNITFDARRASNWDFKSHAVRNKTNRAVLNDITAMDESVRRYGWHGVILSVLDCEYDDATRAFQLWHNELKGGLSQYEKARIARMAPSRLRKTCATLSQILFIGIDVDGLKHLRIYSQGRNSNGSVRAPKYMIDLDDLGDLCVLRWPEVAPS